MEKDSKQFVWFDSFTKSVMTLPEELQAEMISAIVLYGAIGREPEFDDWALKAVFEAVRPNVDNSVAAYENSHKAPKPGKRKRGRPRKSETVAAEIKDPDLARLVEEMEGIC